MATWVKPNGKEIDINDNDATVAYAESLGWKKKAGRPKKKKEK